MDVLVGLVAELLQFAEDFLGGATSGVEHFEQPGAATGELLQLLTGQLTALLQIGEDLLPVRLGLGDHLPALCPGGLELGFGLPGRVLALLSHFEVGLLTSPGRVGLRFPQQSRRTVLGLGANLRRRLPGGGQHSSRLLAEQLGHRLDVEFLDGDVLRLASLIELPLEGLDALPEPGDLGRDARQQVSHLDGVVTLAHRGERR